MTIQCFVLASIPMDVNETDVDNEVTIGDDLPQIDIPSPTCEHFVCLCLYIIKFGSYCHMNLQLM